MTTKNRQWISVDSVINDYLVESEQSNNAYFKVFHSAFRGMENLGIDFFYTVKSVKLPVNANLTVTLPADYINYTKVGVLNNKGEIIPLSYNSKLTSYADLSPNRIEKTQDDTIVDLYNPQGLIWYNFWNGFGYSNLYGLPSGSPFVGSFKIDNANGVILLDENYVYPYLMVEYISSPQEGGEYYIPVQFREALIAWLWWKDNKSKIRKLGAMRDYRHDFYNERRNAVAQYKPVDLIEAYEWSLKNQRLAVKS